APAVPVLREVLGDLDPELVRFHAPEDAGALAHEAAVLTAARPGDARRMRLATAAHRRHGVDAMIDRYMALIAASRPAADGSREPVAEDRAA
ncbi:hypothetical protein VE25_19475, partial [Devosia geojensis]